MTTKQLCFFGAPGSKETNIRLLLGGGRSQHICMYIYMYIYIFVYVYIHTDIDKDIKVDFGYTPI